MKIPRIDGSIILKFICPGWKRGLLLTTFKVGIGALIISRRYLRVGGDVDIGDFYNLDAEN